MKTLLILFILSVRLLAESVEELERLFLSDDERDNSAFMVKARKMVFDTKRDGESNKSLELFLVRGLDDKRKEKQVSYDLTVSPPRSVCAELLSDLTSYENYLKKSKGVSFRRPIFAFDDSAIKELKHWYSEYRVNEPNVIDPKKNQSQSETKEPKQTDGFNRLPWFLGIALLGILAFLFKVRLNSNKKTKK